MSNWRSYGERRPLRCACSAPGTVVTPVFKRVDTCAAEFESFTPYLYSTYEDEDESDAQARPKVMILGSGPEPHRAGDSNSIIVAAMPRTRCAKTVSKPSW